MFLRRLLIAIVSIGCVMLAVLATAQDTSPQAVSFVAAHHGRCLQQRLAPAPEICAMRTIQLASHLHGIAFADEVAQALQ